MSVKNTGLIMPKFGALFTGPENANPLDDLADFTLLAGPTGSTWNHWGHLSRENLPESSSDGGETTTVSTWLAMNTDSETESSVDSTVYSLLQHDAASIAALAAINGSKVSALELWFHGEKQFGIWYPSAKAVASGRPAPNGTDQYAESKLTLTILTPAASLNLASLANPAGGIAPWPSATDPNTLYLDNTAFLAAAA